MVPTARIPFFMAAGGFIYHKLVFPRHDLVRLFPFGARVTVGRTRGSRRRLASPRACCIPETGGMETEASSTADTLFTVHHGRRSVAVLCPVFSLFACHPAEEAFALGISGPKEWLKEQKKKASKYLLAPIEASRQRLRTAHDLLRSLEGSRVEEAKGLMKVAARDCIPQKRNSFVAFQASTGVEVCTFRLIVNNASSLLDDADPVKREAESLLGNLIRSFVLLDVILDGVDPAIDREKVEERLMNAVGALDKFEQGIKNCLDV